MTKFGIGLIVSLGMGASVVLADEASGPGDFQSTKLAVVQNQRNGFLEQITNLQTEEQVLQKTINGLQEELKQLDIESDVEQDDEDGVK